MMTAADLFRVLCETTVAGSAAILLVLALRRPMRHAFGAGIAYAAWALVPLAMLAVLLPAAQVPVLAVRLSRRRASMSMRPVTPTPSSAPSSKAMVSP